MGLIVKLVRLAMIAFMAFSPVLASPARRGRNGVPRRIQAAGRDEGLYRRLQWQKTRQTTVLPMERINKL